VPALSAAGPGEGAVLAPDSVPSAEADDPRNLELEIMTAAVAALRQELARSYAHSQKLTQEGERLRALVSSLRRQLGKRNRENKVLKNRLKALEKKLQEITTPPPEENRTEPRLGTFPETPSVAGSGAEAAAVSPAPPAVPTALPENQPAGGAHRGEPVSGTADMDTAPTAESE
jgi:hypothetical protein